jgi:hypothetical protein
MTESVYAFIKGIEVVNLVVFDDPDNSVLEHFKQTFEVDNIVAANDRAVVGGTYEEGKFWMPQPYTSWVKNDETNEWAAPTPYPDFSKSYDWDEDLSSWVEIAAEEDPEE